MAEPLSAVVVGGVGDIGLAIVRRLVHDNCAVYIADVREVDQGVIASINAEGTGTAVHRRVDACNADEVARVIDEVVHDHGSLDAVAYSAGYWRPSAILDLCLDDWDETLRTNLTGAFVVSRAAGRVMVAQGSGAIVLLSSALAIEPRSSAGHYAAAKAGVGALARALALEVGPAQVRVNAVAPGVVRSRMASSNDPAALRKAIEAIPLGRAAEPDDIADTVRYLLGDQARHITGQTIVVRGGP